MIKAIATSLIILILCSCQTEQEKQKSIKDMQSTELDSTSTDYRKQFRIYTLDSCQYVVVSNGNSTWGSHKGDCTNLIHQK
jgi:hypothetical protein